MTHTDNTKEQGCLNRCLNPEDQLYWYWLVNIPSLGPAGCRRLLQMHRSPREIFQCSEEELKKVLPAGKVRALSQSKDLDRCLRELHVLQKNGIKFICRDSEEYPERLRHIYDPPLALYLIGKLPDFSRPVLAVVGSRKATVYGLRQAYTIAKELALKGVQIISGLAAGIDSAGHRGALEGRGYTMGVLGGGIDTMYPQENFNLYREIYEKGGVLSEYNVGIPNHKGLFPQRNRIISGLSDGVFVVQAGKRSGSLITADLGLNQGKTIFALPGRVTDPCSIGTNSLIAQGAVMVNRAEDILEELDLIPGFSSPTTAAGHFTEEEKLVLSLLPEDQTVSFGQLSKVCPLNDRILIHILIDLEMRGFLCQSGKDQFSRI